MRQHHTDFDATVVILYGHHWWDSSHYTLIYVQVTALQIETNYPIESK